MATALANAIAARDQILERIVELTASQNPDTTIDGEQVLTGQNLEQLQRSLDALTKTIQQLQPYEIRTRGY